jgi:hypothetical protein
MSDNNNDFKEKFLNKYIVPNYYTPQHLGIDNWSEEKIKNFKEYMRSVVDDSSIREFVDACISEFEDEYVEEEIKETPPPIILKNGKKVIIEE